MSPAAMETGPKGPGAIQQRMEQIQSKMDAFFGNNTSGDFQANLDQATGALSGQVPGGLDGNSPMSPAGLMMVPEGANGLKQMAIEAAQRYGIDPNLFIALINKESGFNPSARSGKGAAGLSQLMPDTAAGLGVKDRLDPVQSLDGGAKYLSQLMDQFGTPELALAAYNAGPNKVLAAGGIPAIPETQDYVSSIMKAVAARHNP
jgi:hypothetical protein